MYLACLSVPGGEEGQQQQFLVRATFSSLKNANIFKDIKLENFNLNETFFFIYKKFHLRPNVAGFLENSFV